MMIFIELPTHNATCRRNVGSKDLHTLASSRPETNRESIVLRHLMLKSIYSSATLFIQWYTYVHRFHVKHYGSRVSTSNPSITCSSDTFCPQPPSARDFYPQGYAAIRLRCRVLSSEKTECVNVNLRNLWMGMHPKDALEFLREANAQSTNWFRIKKSIFQTLKDSDARIANVGGCYDPSSSLLLECASRNPQAASWTDLGASRKYGEMRKERRRPANLSSFLRVPPLAVTYSDYKWKLAHTPKSICSSVSGMLIQRGDCARNNIKIQSHCVLQSPYCTIDFRKHTTFLLLLCSLKDSFWFLYWFPNYRVLRVFCIINILNP